MPDLFAPGQFRDWRAEREIVRAAISPRVYRFCEFLTLAWRCFAYSSGIGLALIFVPLFTNNIRPLSLARSLVVAGFVEMCACLALALFCFLLRFTLIALIFTRYSLLHIVSVILAVNGLATLFVLLPDYFKAIPILLGMWLGLIAYCYIVGQDPKAGQPLPEFIRTQVVARKYGGVKQ